MKLNKDNLIGVIIGFIVLVIFAICLSSGCAKRITPVPEIRYVPVTDCRFRKLFPRLPLKHIKK